ncbi:hypothetical protein QNH38_07995 [Paenibacillus polymyxa]|uniref:hypothetical protein n=1 Tax=Paenibacillus polymyxa TaxID=1406 RepID=UPI0024C03BD4|nr:hypothetical protein [Paenibacillus polymyxa]WHX37372.1 hypothetical protein QNH38_07995 [Paenibacillus polymyxa]
MNTRWRQFKKLVPAEDFYECYHENKPQLCPICHGKLEVGSYHEGYHGCVETYRQCKGCGYTRQWSYGTTYLEVGKWFINYFYSTPDKEVERIEAEFAREIVKERNRRKTEIRKYYRNRG